MLCAQQVRAKAEGASLGALMRSAVQRYASGELTSTAEPASQEAADVTGQPGSVGQPASQGTPVVIASIGPANLPGCRVRESGCGDAAGSRLACRPRRRLNGSVPRMKRKRDLFWLKNWRVLTLCGGCIVAGFLLGMLIFGSPWHLPPAWGDIPTWITAIATVGLLAGAIVTAIYAIRAFRAQSKEVSDQANMLKVQSQQLEEQRKINAEQTTVLRLQAKELGESLAERKQEAQLRMRAQAERVFISQENTTAVKPEEDDEPVAQRATVTVVNTSDRPIYQAGLRWSPGSSWDLPGIPEPLGTIMPGDRIERFQYFSPGTDMAVNGATLIFRDAAKVSWTLTPDGELTEKQIPVTMRQDRSQTSRTS